MNNTILIIVLAVYFLAMVGIGWVGKKKYGNNFDNSISAGRNVGVMLFIGAAVGTHIGNGFVVGGQQAVLLQALAEYGMALYAHLHISYLRLP